MLENFSIKLKWLNGDQTKIEVEGTIYMRLQGKESLEIQMDILLMHKQTGNKLYFLGSCNKEYKLSNTDRANIPAGQPDLRGDHEFSKYLGK